MASKDYFDQAQKNAQVVFDFVRSALNEFGIPDWLAIGPSMGAATLIYAGGIAQAAFLAISVGVAVPLAEAILQLISDTRAELQPALNQLIGQTLSEMLGVEISGEDLPGATSTSNTTARMQAIGNKVYTQLLNEFVPHGTVTPESGEAAAKAFAGYGINFAVTNSFISILSEMLSDDHLEQFRELGVEIANNLGLGRLQRRALGVLLANTIEKPYTDQLRARYRPDRLSDVQYVNAYMAGRSDLPTLRKELGYKGYSDAYQDELVAQLEQRAPDGDLETIMRWQAAQGNALPSQPANGQFSLSDLQRLNPDQAVQVLKNRGMSEETARQRIVSLGLSKADKAVEFYAAEVERLAVHGFLDVESARSLLQGLPLSPEELKYKMAVIGLQLEYPRKQLTLAEMETAYVDGVIDLTQWDAWLQRQGYSAEDQQTLTFLLQIKADAAAHKKAGHPAVLTFAEITTAYVDGFVDLAGAQSWMHTKGYSAHDQTVLTQILQAKLAAKKPKA